MKKFKFVPILLGILAVMFLCFPVSNEKENTPSYALCTKGESFTSNTNESTNFSYVGTNGGNIPFSLFTSVKNADDTYEITDYYPEFEESFDSQSGYTYKMRSSSVPYFLLSSKSGLDDGGSETLNTPYNTTVNFRFNDPNGKIEGSGNISGINALMPNASVQNYTNPSSISLKASPDELSSSDYTYTFRVNLLSLSTPGVECPKLNNLNPGDSGSSDATDTYLGGNEGESSTNDVSQRTGLYSFVIQYYYTSREGSSSRCTFEVSFYVIDYNDYEEGKVPLSFENTTTYEKSPDSEDNYLNEYHLYNYNFENAPVISYDATKFALNFTYTFDSITFNFNQTAFVYENTDTHTGKVTLTCTDFGATYDFYTYEEEENRFVAKLYLQDFEETFITTNSKNLQSATFQGDYFFDMDIVVRGSNDGLYSKVDKSLFSDEIKLNLTKQRLVIFGYDLRYNDNDPSSSTYGLDMPLRSSTNRNTIFATNDTATEEGGTLLFKIDSIITTNRAPLRFHSYGDFPQTNDYSVDYYLFDYNSLSEQNLLTSLNEKEDKSSLLEVAEGGAKNSYKQSSIISRTESKIWFMALEYTVRIKLDIERVVEGEKKVVTEWYSIGATQYVLFAINNNLQGLSINAVDDEGFYTFNTYTNRNVIIGIENKDNYFYAPTVVSYTVSYNFNNTPNFSSNLSLKRNSDGSLATYKILDKTYNYFVTNNNNDFTFDEDGYYTVSIKNTLDNTRRGYEFYIDRQPFDEISVNSVITSSNGRRVKGEALLYSEITNGEFLTQNLYVTSSPFTLSWRKKQSKDYVALAFMPLSQNLLLNQSLYKKGDEYVLTNSYEFSSAIVERETNYHNSYNETVLSEDSYFYRSGLYYFYVYDQAGNSFSVAVLIDDSRPAVAQGRWSGDPETTNWQNTFDSVNNPQNYVSTDTILYFGTHKALKLPDLDREEKLIELEDRSFTFAYSKETGEALDKSKLISFDFYSMVVKNLSTHFIDVEENYEDIFRAHGSTGKYYLSLVNNSVSYRKITSNIDTTVTVLEDFLNPLYRTAIYANAKDELFSGEADYEFIVQNENGLTNAKFISMNFDFVKGTFYAYNEAENSHYIRKNTATNLSTLKFEYSKYTGDGASFYEIQNITFDYFPFALNPEDSNFSQETYPFARNGERGEFNLEEIAPNQLGIYSIDPINVSYSSVNGVTRAITKPGKYVITRTYRGGTHNLNNNGEYVLTDLVDENGVHYGGRYYMDGDGNPIDLFTLDSLTRQYVVYVDHNGIITDEYFESSNMPLVRQVGDNISLTLNYGGDNAWVFKDFFKTQNPNRMLVTNKVPVLINIPRSKYTYYDNNNIFHFSTLDFTKLSVKIEYTNTLGRVYIYNITGYNELTNMMTSIDLVTNSNPDGLLLFSGEGDYKVTIFDNTGYIEYNNYGSTLNNYPTEFSFTFRINYSYSALSIYTSTYDAVSGTFVNKRVENEDGSNNYAINIKKNNGQSGEIVDNNELYLVIDDPRTPYIGKTTSITVTKRFQNNSSTTTINLSSFDLQELAETNRDLLDIARTSQFVGDYLLKLNVSYYDENYPFEVYDNQNYYRFSYRLSLDLEDEAEYEISLSRDLEIDSLKEAKYLVSIDRTKPNYNIDRLINQEDYLNVYYSSILNHFKEEDLNVEDITNIPTILTYTFGINSNFVLENRDTVPYFYIRSYTKYSLDGDSSNSSITPDCNFRIVGYPVFSEGGLSNNIIQIGSNTWYRANYTGGSLYSIISSTLNTSPNGYYEIIEKDYAGNYRVFTVYFLQNSNNAYSILNFNGSDEDNFTFNTLLDSDVTAKENFTLRTLSSMFGWGTVILRNERLGYNFESAITLSPYSTIESNSTLINRINEFLSTPLDCRFSLTLVKYNSSFPMISRGINIIKNNSFAKLPAPQINEVPGEKTTYNLVFPEFTSSSHLYLESLELQIYNTLTKSWQRLRIFNTKEEVRANQIIRGLDKGTYKVIYTDNYNERPYEYNLYVGEFRINNFTNEYVFEYNNVYDEENLVYYTGGNVDVTYEGNIYEVYVNGIKYSGSSYERNSQRYQNNCKTFTLTSNFSYANIPARQSVGGVTNYLVEYRDITDGQVQKTYNIVIFDRLPEIRLTHENMEIASTLVESDTQITNTYVRIDWGKISGAGLPSLNDYDENVVSVANLYKKNSNGEYELLRSIDRGYVVQEEGYYRLQIKNNILQNYRTIYFVIQFGDFPLYTVTVDGNEIEYSNMEVFDLTKNEPNLSGLFNINEANSRIVEVLYRALTSLYNNGRLQGSASRPKSDYQTLVESMGFRNGVFSGLNIGVANVTNVYHYYTISTPEIIYNSNMEINVVEFVFRNRILDSFYIKGEGVNTTPNSVGENYYTTIYLVYSLNGPIKIQLFAITKVPRTSNLLTDRRFFYDNNKEITFDPSSNTTPEKYLTSKDINSDRIEISYNYLLSNENIFWYNQGNVINLYDKYGVEEDFYKMESTFDEVNKRNISVISKSGEHQLMFMDLAGNRHRFTTNTFIEQNLQNVFTLHVLDKVIYNIVYENKTYNPIQYGVFNESLTLVVDPKYVDKYTNLQVAVTRNGVNYSNYTRSGNTYTFSESGRFQVTFRASYEGADLIPNIYNFTIVIRNSARLAFEFPEITGYEFIQVMRNGQDISNNFRENGKITSLFISSQDALSGNGSYVVTLKYGERASDTLTFAFSINNYVPTLTCNVNYGESTTQDIIISYNPSLIYSQLGKCYIRVLVYNNDSKTYYLFGSVEINENSTGTLSSLAPLTQSNSYFIQIQTENGNVVSSFRVNKTDPLNFFAIIAIVVAVVAVVVILIVVIKLRTRMRVR